MRNIIILLSMLLFTSGIAAQEQFTLYFDFDIDKPTQESSQRLAEWITLNKGIDIIKIYGYADSIGSKDYNIDLSWRRAKHVQQQLNSAYKIVPEIEIKGFGETNAFSENRSSDRIVVIHYNNPPEQKISKPQKKSLTNAMKYARIGEKLRLDNLNFYGNTGKPLPHSMPVLSELLQIMTDNPKLEIEIQGHICCDPRNTKGVDEMRVKTVYEFLVKNGVSEDRLHYRTFGTTRPLYPLPEQNEQQRVANRRVEIEILAQ